MSEAATPQEKIRRPLALQVTSLACVVVMIVLLGVRWLNASNVFPPVRMDRAQAPKLAQELPDVREVSLPTTEGATLYAWVLGRDDAPRKFIRFMGNAEHIGGSAQFYSRESADAQMLLFDYRGRGNSNGKPSERAMYEDAQAVWHFAVNELRWQPQSIILWGRSLGCVPATWLAHRQVEAGDAPGALVLESAFTSAQDMAREIMPWLGKPEWLVYSLLDNASRAPGLKLPVFQLHGREDRIVPMMLGWRLHEAMPGPKEWLELPGARHNDIWSSNEQANTIRSRLDEFLTEHGL